MDTEAKKSHPHRHKLNATATNNSVVGKVAYSVSSLQVVRMAAYEATSDSLHNWNYLRTDRVNHM
jgi:hypothetical protein